MFSPSDSTLIDAEKSFINSDLNGEEHSSVIHCQFKLNNGSHCLNQAVDFICGHCTNKFCLAHLNEHAKEEKKASRSNITSSDSTSNNNRLVDAVKSSSITCTPSCSSCTCSSSCSCTTCSCSVKSTLVSEESIWTFHPIAASTPLYVVEPNTSPRQAIFKNGNHRPANDVINVSGPMTNNQERLHDVTKTEPVNVSPVGITSNDLYSTLKPTSQEKSNVKKQKNALQSESSIKENDERLNRINFFLKDIATFENYVDIFYAILRIYPFVQPYITDTSARIQYLCVADTSTSSPAKRVSIHLSFQKKVNFKHKFLDQLFPDMKISDYLYVTNGDQFNNEIKSLSKGRYIESPPHTTKKAKFGSIEHLYEKKEEVAAAAFLQQSFNSAVDIVRNNLKFDYLARGEQIRGNIEFELQRAKKRKAIEYKPVYDSTTFKIPEEHRWKIREWLRYDFQMRNDGTITRSRCLFMVGPTQHGS